ncbi:MAG: ATP-binding protein [Candidatus Omnitrophota bacterium]
MIKRIQYPLVFSSEWGRQMRFITGPRQSGKTTISKMKLSDEHTEKLYYLWDLRSVRQRYKANEFFFTEDMPAVKNKKLWVCFDEIHKIPKWKNILKGIFDQTQEYYQFIITGSAKFDISRRAGDSLSGRYFIFHLFPLTLREVNGNPAINPQQADNALDFILSCLEKKPSGHALDALLEYSGFPEPFVRQSKLFQNKWSQDYLDRIIKEDIGMLTRIIDRDCLYDLYKLLPEMVGSPVSENSLASHLETSPSTIKNYLKRLADFYLCFRLPPYSKNIKRALLKASKWYLYDWTRIDDQAKRFENFAAVELHTLLNLWTDLTAKSYSLYYIRDRNKKETDFLILKENKPWLMIEVKLTDSPVEHHHTLISQGLDSIPIVQLCRQENIACQEKKNIFRLSASRFFS